MAPLISLSEYLGHPRLLGFSALLAWLVLFHLLVNVWLLCIFTSFLVVLGGWLGSRALLDADSLLHLEHFLPLGKLNPPVYSPEHEWRLNHEIHSAAHKAVRDFVSSWYRTVLPEVEGEFERAVLDSMLESVMELKERARRVDRKELIQRLLEVYGCHLQSYITAKEIHTSLTGDISLWEIYSEVDTPHPAVGSDERSYSKALVNLVLHVLVPYPQMETRTGGYMVTELITCNVLLPLLHRVADPDWLNQTIVEIFTRSKAPPEMTPLPTDTLYRYPIQHESWTTCRSLSSSDRPLLAGQSSSDFEDQLSSFSGDSPRSSVSSIASSDRTESRPESMIAQCNVSCCSMTTAQCSHLPKCKKMLSMAPLIQSDSDNDLIGRFCECGPSANFCKAIHLEEDEPFGCFAPLKNLGPKQVVPEESLWPSSMSRDKSLPRRFDHALDCANHPSAPVNIQNVHISGTITAKEQSGTSSNLFTVYTIKFETVNESEKGASKQSLTSHTVNRRYSEFLNLQTRLEEKPEMKKVMKNIKGPKKIFPDISFGNSDSEKVEARKCQLDSFLKQLISIAETANSEDMQEFLGLNSDISTYFGRRPLGKSRIDKMMENALDTLKTAFPYPDLSPTEDSEGDTDGRIPDIRKYRRLTMFQNRMSATLNISELPPKVSYCYSESSTMLNGMTLSGMEKFVQDQEQRLCRLNEKETLDSWKKSSKDKKSLVKTCPDTAVADVALSILCLLMKDQWSWLCTENIQKAIRLLFGTFIERWLDVGVAHLTSAPCWVIYLQVLQEAVWPGGTLPAQPRPERTAAQREETKERCLECLMQLIPQLATDMLGSEKFRLSLETVLESLQDYHINKAGSWSGNEKFCLSLETLLDSLQDYHINNDLASETQSQPPITTDVPIPDSPPLGVRRGLLSIERTEAGLRRFGGKFSGRESQIQRNMNHNENTDINNKMNRAFNRAHHCCVMWTRAPKAELTN